MGFCFVPFFVTQNHFYCFFAFEVVLNIHLLGVVQVCQLKVVNASKERFYSFYVCQKNAVHYDIQGVILRALAVREINLLRATDLLEWFKRNSRKNATAEGLADRTDKFSLGKPVYLLHKRIIWNCIILLEVLVKAVEVRVMFTGLNHEAFTDE